MTRRSRRCRPTSRSTARSSQLDHAPGINFLSHLPGQAPGDVPIGGKVKLTFEATQATGQKVPEWNVVK